MRIEFVCEVKNLYQKTPMYASKILRIVSKRKKVKSSQKYAQKMGTLQKTVFYEQNMAHINNTCHLSKHKEFWE